MNPQFIPCVPKTLPAEQLVAAAQTAIRTRPSNRPDVSQLAGVIVAMTGVGVDVLPPAHIALLTSKYWGVAGVKLSVSFLEPIAADLRDRILSHMNAWGQWCNTVFAWSQSNGSVRITRSGNGYWSYLGTDILHIPSGQPTMCLQGFTMQTPESEYHRVVRHETAHTLGAVHEHQRREIVQRLDPAKTIAWGQQVLGWDAQTVRQQILTPLDESALSGTALAEQDSVMAYALPASITTDGLPVTGGTDITAHDAAFMASKYPLPVAPPPSAGLSVTVPQPIPAGTYTLARS